MNYKNNDKNHIPSTNRQYPTNHISMHNGYNDLGF